MAAGRTNREIAEDLHISVHTVKAHIARLFERLHVNNRMEAVMEAIRLGLIDQ
jgi:DNA-binding NarL/FixJ family response regulator